MDFYIALTDLSTLPTLEDVQRRLKRATKTLSRAEAGIYNHKYGLPCLHIGWGRFLPLSTMLSTYGLDKTLVLAQDPRSLLVWTMAENTAQAVAMIFQTTLNLKSHAAQNGSDRRMIEYFAGLTVIDEEPGAVGSLLHFCREMHRYFKTADSSRAIEFPALHLLLEMMVMAAALITITGRDLYGIEGLPDDHVDVQCRLKHWARHLVERSEGMIQQCMAFSPDQGDQMAIPVVLDTGGWLRKTAV